MPLLASIRKCAEVYDLEMTFTDLEVEPDDVLRRMRVDGRQNTSVLLLQLLTKTHTHTNIYRNTGLNRRLLETVVFLPKLRLSLGISVD